MNTIKNKMDTELTENERAVKEYEQLSTEFYEYPNNGYFYSRVAERRNKAYARLWDLGVLPIEP